MVGAGPHSLSIVAHLLAAEPSLRDRIAVVDPTGRWMRTWHEQFARLEIGVLRSPIVHHPHVDPGALANYVAGKHLPRSGLPYDPPLTRVFASFCSGLIQSLDLDDMVLEGRVSGLTVGDGMTVATTNGAVTARHVVWAANTAVPVVPAGLEAATDAGAIRHASSIDLRSIGSLDDEHITIVGGGLTAAHLAVAAVDRGAAVTLATRRPITERDFDVEPGWLGPRCLDGYWRLDRPDRRLDTARNARGGGSIPGWMLRRLQSEMQAGRIDHVIGAIDGCSVGTDGVELGIAGSSTPAGQCWLATGTRPDVRADQALAPHVDAHLDGIPVVGADLRVGAGPLYVTGRLATMELGPAAGNLWGARMASRRITNALTGRELDDDAVTEIKPPPVSVVEPAGGVA